MQQEIEITDQDIQYAERILLPEGRTFDPERRAFICNLNTLDLQAVPGSGKTTVLLAKLLILETKLPFSDGSGVLVLSHTNAAVDEIKERIQKYCPKLFSYPNFIGTIQGFVDEFLAIPLYIQKFKKKPIRIDNEIYEEKIDEIFGLNLRGFSAQEQSNARHFLMGNNCKYTFRFDYVDNDTKLIKGINDLELAITKPRRGRNWQDFTDNDKVRIKDWLKRFKYNVMQHEGVLHFDDAYFLAKIYLVKYPTIKTILQQRFQLVFVDEMQDMDTHQYNILEEIFFIDSTSIYQRIGDKNQAIYNSVKTMNLWQDRDLVLPLNGSQRLSPPIANLVKKFAIDTNGGNFDIIGLNNCGIKPHILVFNNDTISNILPTFTSIIRENDLQNKGKLKAICWNTDWKEDQESRNDPNKLRLEDYYPSFKKEKAKPKQDYNCLKSYLMYFNRDKKTLAPIRKNILHALLRILRLERINDVNNTSYSIQRLINYLKVFKPNEYEILNHNLYNWSLQIVKGEVEDVYENIKNYIPDFLLLFKNDGIITMSGQFIDSDPENIIEVNQDNSTSNCYVDDDIEVDITSIHSVKGQTHIATLYLESFYQGSYESEKLSQQFLGNTFDDRRVHHKSSTKMAYVGLSRPTDLLCIAIHQTRFDQLEENLNLEMWEIRNVE
ncbi:UvrD-helicase domain-containing protein [Myroides odoratimimus]|uniref:UvrD-helicase domain-containing protein n=1 Tax=Myroides odoratimimus TaxID=76832 RepID=UPI000910B7B9|nr:UvrD-helicase domain-containing protein [Myroides odoratimimus]SHM36668.1 Superfamily I DNA or RNA helicase [Myroides odoratimimus subsp. xuanwuensis]